MLLSVILLVFVFVRASRGNSAKGPWNPSQPVPRKFGATARVEEVATARVEEVATARVEEVASTHGNVTKDTFDAIYDYHIWEPDSTADDNGGGSGPGSSMAYTRRTRALVEMLIFKYNIGLLIDAPCGAMKWMSTVVDYVTNSAGANPKFQYVGLDIVESVIMKNREAFSHIDNMHFEVKDLSREAIEAPRGVSIPPAGQKTAIFSRDALQHLNFDLVVSTMKRMAESSADIVILGSYHNKGTNKNITTGEYFVIDLSKRPFSPWLPAPLEVVSEETIDYKHFAVYDRNELAQVDFDAMLDDARTHFGG